MTSRALARLATIAASTKRSPAISDGIRSGPQTYLSSIKVTPLDPVTEEIRRRPGLETPHELLMCYAVGDLDIKAGDILVVGSNEYPIKAVGEWYESPQGNDDYCQLIIEDLKR